MRQQYVYHPIDSIFTLLNRGEDTIVIYKIQKDGTLEFLERHYLPGQFPRDFNISKRWKKFWDVALEYSDLM